MALLIWSIYIRTIWQNAHSRLVPADEPGVPSGWRAVSELFRSMEAEFSRVGIDVTTMTDSRAKREIRERLNGGTVSFQQHQLPECSGLSAFLAWLCKEKWWIIAFFTCAAATIVVLFKVLFRYMWLGGIITTNVLLGWLVLSVGLVVWIGTTTGSRLIMLLALGLLGIPVAFIETILRLTTEE